MQNGFARSFFGTLQFPQGFHSGTGISNLRKPFKKDPFSRLNRRFRAH
jgi:hypothetical protein